MKKFVYASMISIILISFPVSALASSTLQRVGETVLIEVLSTVINDALKKNGMGDLIPGLESPDSDAPTQTGDNLPKSSRNSGEVTELSDEQFQSFSEICLVGSLEEFRKKIEYENISHEAKYTKSDGTVITLLELAKTSPNPDLAEFLTGPQQEQATPAPEQESEAQTEGE